MKFFTPVPVILQAILIATGMFACFAICCAIVDQITKKRRRTRLAALPCPGVVNYSVMTFLPL